MAHKIAFIFPGQGAQYVGMGKDFYEQFPSSREIFEKADHALQRPFSDLIFRGNSQELTQTKNSQLAIFIVSLAVHAALRCTFPEIVPDVCAGLSLGEYTALVASGKLSFEDGLSLVEKRAAFMQQACEAIPGSMNVVLGMEPDSIRTVLEGLSIQAWIANLNCPGQVVIAGTLEGLEKAALALKEAGAKRVLPLEVSGAFHSALMQPARDLLSPYLLEAPLQNTPIDLVMNTPGDFVKDTGQIRKFLIEQVTQPVLYQKGIEAMLQAGVDFFIEMGPGKTLQGMNKKIGVTCPTKNIEKSSELQDWIQEKGMHAYGNA
jgi:[acyl-carrier-protein] S-malonyltransferase